MCHTPRLRKERRCGGRGGALSLSAGRQTAALTLSSLSPPSLSMDPAPDIPTPRKRVPAWRRLAVAAPDGAPHAPRAAADEAPPPPTSRSWRRRSAGGEAEAATPQPPPLPPPARRRHHPALLLAAGALAGAAAVLFLDETALACVSRAVRPEEKEKRAAAPAPPAPPSSLALDLARARETTLVFHPATRVVPTPDGWVLAERRVALRPTPPPPPPSPARRGAAAAASFGATWLAGQAAWRGRRAVGGAVDDAVGQTVRALGAATAALAGRHARRLPRVGGGRGKPAPV